LLIETLFVVMAGLVPAIHVLSSRYLFFIADAPVLGVGSSLTYSSRGTEDVDARVKPGHDERPV